MSKYKTNILAEKCKSTKINAKGRRDAKRIIYFFMANGDFKAAKNMKALIKEAA